MRSARRTWLLYVAQARPKAIRSRWRSVDVVEVSSDERDLSVGNVCCALGDDREEQVLLVVEVVVDRARRYGGLGCDRVDTRRACSRHGQTRSGQPSSSRRACPAILAGFARVLPVLAMSVSLLTYNERCFLLQYMWYFTSVASWSIQQAQPAPQSSLTGEPVTSRCVHRTPERKQSGDGGDGRDGSAAHPTQKDDPMTHEVRDQAEPRRWGVLALLGLAQLMVVLDGRS